MSPEETLSQIKEMCALKNVDPHPSFLFNPKELEDPFSVLIAVILSHQTRDAQTSAAHERLLRAFPTPEGLSMAPIKKIDSLINEVGFHTKKARAIKAIAHEVAANGMPRTSEALMKLPLVGRKTAACVEVYGYGGQAIPVDTHVFRVSNRIGLVAAKTPDDAELALKRLFPRRLWREINYFMVSMSSCLVASLNLTHPRLVNNSVCPSTQASGPSTMTKVPGTFLVRRPFI